MNFRYVASVACVVEGHGERTAVPVLVKRIAQQLSVGVTVPPAIRDKKSRLITEDGLKRAVSLAAISVSAPRRVLVILDADGDCPAELGPQLQAWAHEARPDVPSAVVIAKQEYEAWLLAGATGLRGQRGLPVAFEGPPLPEAIQGAKEWISRQLPQGQIYKPTLDQAALTATFDLVEARRSDSFDKCYRELERLLAEV